MNEETARDRAITAVDNRNGYSLEYAFDPEYVRDQYDAEEERILSEEAAVMRDEEGYEAS